MSLEEEIKDVLYNEIRPRIQMDGGDVEFVEFDEDGVVVVELKGACVGCMAAGMTLKMGIERYLKIKFPEIKKVVTMS